MIAPKPPRTKSYPKTTPADWKAGNVTVCIAAMADSAKKIVMASDSRAAFGDYSSDVGVIKNIPLGNHYVVLLAGNDVSYAMPTIVRAKKYLPPAMNDPDEVADILHEQLVETRKRKIEARILSKFGFTVDTFLSEGKAALTETAYHDLLSRIDREELSLTFLLAGFDSSKNAHLRVVSADDSPLDYDMLGFAAIGSGASSAMSSLAFSKDHSGLSQYNEFEEVTYCVMAAKFMAESATDVGRDMFYVCIDADSVCNFISIHWMLDAIRESWEKDGAPRSSLKTMEIIKDSLYCRTEDMVDAQQLSRLLKHLNGVKRESLELLIKTLQTSGSHNSKDRQ